MNPPGPSADPLGRELVRVVWPAFLAACVLEMCVFAMVDPLHLHWSGHALEWSRQAIYTASFFLFWLIAAGACAMTALLARREVAVM